MDKIGKINSMKSERRYHMDTLGSFTIHDLERLIEEDRTSGETESNTARRLAKGEAHLRKKLGEEVIEVILAESNVHLVEEMADLLTYAMTLLKFRKISFSDVEMVLRRRTMLDPRETKKALP